MKRGTRTMGRKEFLKLTGGAVLGGICAVALGGMLAPHPAFAASLAPSATGRAERTLFDATNIGSLRLKNRVIRAATGDRFAVDGHMTERDLALYETLARGGAGTIITGFTYVSGTPCIEGMFGITDDSFIPEYRRLTERVHGLGASIMMQLVYCGTLTRFDAADLLGPSAVPHVFSGKTPRAMNAAEIAQVQADFAAAARRARLAGFDGVELHMAHGFLLSQFNSPHYNRRTDDYGGSDAARARMSIETYEAVRREVGSDYTIFAKINCQDGQFADGPGGVTPQGFATLCAGLAARGLDAIAVSGSWHDYGVKDGVYFLEQALQMQAACGIPVFPVGGHRDPARMAELLDTTALSYFPMGRPLLSEPDLPARWQAGDASPARCTSCNTCVSAGHEARCIFNDA